MTKLNTSAHQQIALPNQKNNSVMVEARSLADAFAQIFGAVDHHFVDDGLIHRFDDPTGRPGNQACWYVYHPAPQSYAVFGSWRYGQNYYTDLRCKNLVNSKPFRKLLIEQSKQKYADAAARQELAALTARSIWELAEPASNNNKYLKKKVLPPFDLRSRDGALLIPLHDGMQLVNLQRIFPDGRKRFLKNGKTKGCYYQFGVVTDAPKVMLCEGWATGATLHMWYGMPVFCAMTVSNLLQVAVNILQRYPQVELIICADDDRKTTGNPGMYYAQQVQKKLGGSLFVPQWPDDAPLELTDFNDLYLWLLQYGGADE